MPMFKFDRGAYDYGTGYIRIMADLEDRFGPVQFGYAGGCVNMIIDLESGHRVNVTNADECYLTGFDEHSAEHDGFSVGIYPLETWGEGADPLLMLTARVGTSGLPDLIASAISALVTAKAM